MSTFPLIRLMKIISNFSCLIFFNNVVNAELASSPIELMSIIPMKNIVLSNQKEQLQPVYHDLELRFDSDKNLQDNLQLAVNTSENIELEYACQQANILSLYEGQAFQWGDEERLWEYIARINQSLNLYFSLAFNFNDYDLNNVEYLQGINGQTSIDLKFNIADIDAWLADKRYQVQASLKDEKFYTSAILSGNYLYQSTINRKDWAAAIEKSLVTFLPKLSIEKKLWTTVGLADENDSSKLLMTWDPDKNKNIRFNKEDLLPASHPLMKDLSKTQLAEYISRKIIGGLYHAKPVLLAHQRRNQWRDDIADSPYSAWQPKRNKQTLWLAANDGMLHVLDDATGEELLAYMPAFLASNQAGEGFHSLLENTDLAKTMLDATPAIYDAYYEGQWRTVVAGTAGINGQGVYALELGQTIEDTRVLWEFVHPDLGQSRSTPVIGKLANGRWAVLVNNGYQSLLNETSVFVLYLDADLSDGWTLGKDYLRIQIPTLGTIDNGLSALTALSLGDGHKDTSFRVKQGIGEINRLYAGDLTGRLWAINLHSTDPKQWQAELLFQAAKGQSIVHAAEVYAVDENEACDRRGCEKSLLLLFGTGKLLSKSDREDNVQQTFYALRDFMPAKRDVYYRTDLYARDSEEEQGNHALAGWYLDYDDATEHLQASPKLVAEQVIFQTVKLDMQFCSSKISSQLYKIGAFIEDTANTSHTVNNNLDDDYLISTDLGSWASMLVYSKLQGFYQLNADGHALMTTELNEDKPFTGVLRKAEVYMY